MTPSWMGWQADAILLASLVLLAFFVWRIAHAMAVIDAAHKRLLQKVSAMPSTDLVTDWRMQLNKLEVLAESTQREMQRTAARMGRVEDFLMQSKHHASDR